jgi:dynein heavy chain
MPFVETYGAQPPIELLRQYADHKGFYDRQKLFWKDVTDSVIVSSAAPPGGGRAVMTTRFTRHFHMLCIPPASEEVLQSIFGSIFTGFASIFAEDIKTSAKKVVAATIEVFNRTRETMKPTPVKSHYTFNLRDVSKVFQGVLMIMPKECQTLDTLAKLWAHEVSSGIGRLRRLSPSRALCARRIALCSPPSSPLTPHNSACACSTTASSTRTTSSSSRP